MAEESIHQTATDGAASKSHRVRRVVLALAAAVVLGWGGWFAWLVAVELRTEQRLHDPMARLSYEEVESQQTFESFIRLVGAKTGVRVEANLPEEIMSAPWPLYVDLPSQHHRSPHRTSPQFGVIWTLNWGIEWIWSGEMFDLRIEGDTYVITTADNAPSLDASAKAREWWHAMEKWWEGGP